MAHVGMWQLIDIGGYEGYLRDMVARMCWFFGRMWWLIGGHGGHSGEAMTSNLVSPFPQGTVSSLAGCLLEWHCLF